MTNKQKKQLNLFLFSLVIILVFIILYPQNPTHQPLRIQTGLIEKEAKLINITIAKKKFTLKKDQNNQWSYVEPLLVDAINGRIEKLLNILNTPYLRKYPQQEINKKELGLQPPLAKLQINTEDFFFGNVEPISKHRFVLHQDQVYLIKDVFFPLIDARTQGLANTRLLKHGFDAIKLQSPYLKDANILLENWRNKKALGVEKLGTKKPIESVTLSNTNTSITFNILQFEPLFILNPQGKNVQYLLASEDIPLLLGNKTVP